MPLRLVKATWIEDEAEASEKWEVNADTAHGGEGCDYASSLSSPSRRSKVVLGGA